jgi:hypothetical protein
MSIQRAMVSVHVIEDIVYCTIHIFKYGASGRELDISLFNPYLLTIKVA